MGRSAGRTGLPGAGNLTFAALYVLTSVAVLAIPGKPGSLVGVNPSIARLGDRASSRDWRTRVVIATLAFRYLSIADEVPEPPPRRQPAPQPRRGRGR